MTVDEWLIYIEANSVLTDVNIIELRQAFYITGWIDAAKLSKLFKIDESVDYVNSQPKLRDLLIDIVVDYLLNDTDESDITGIYDVVTKSEGDTVLRYIDKGKFSTEVRTALLLEINEKANIIESTKMVAAIAAIS